MKKTIKLKTINDLKLTKQELKYDVRLQEEILGSAFLKLRTSFSDSVKTTSRKYAQKFITLILLRLLRGKFKDRREEG